MKIYLAGPATMALLALGLAVSGLAADTAALPEPDTTLVDDRTADALVAEVFADAGREWWHKDWTFRRKVRVEDPRLPLGDNAPVVLHGIDPLLLRNTDRCRDEGADLRVVTLDGKVLRSGVMNFGRDDGSGVIWCLPAKKPESSVFLAYVYYGNPNAPATGDTLPDGAQPGSASASVTVWPEDIAAGGALPARAAPGAFFTNLVAIEAEAFTATNAQGASLVGTKDDAGASAGGVLVGTTSGAAIARARLAIPEKGTWSIHVRYRHAAGQPVMPFTLALGEREFPCGTNAAGGFHWDSFRAELPAGLASAALTLAADAAPDCLILTRDANYRPDCRDINGPVWMRFKVLGENGPPYCAELFCKHWSAEGPKGRTACYFFREYPVPTLSLARPLAAETANLARWNEWTPWGQTLAMPGVSWWVETTFRGKGDPQYGALMRGLKVAFEFATRPDVSRLFRDGAEEVSAEGPLMINMPSTFEGRIDLAAIRAHTLGFAQWARKRFEEAQAMGFKANEGPRQLVASTLASANSAEEADYILKTLNWLGLNTVTLYLADGKKQGELAQKNGIPWSWTYARPEYPPSDLERSPIPTNRLTGKTFTQTFDYLAEHYAETTFKAWRESWPKSNPWEFAHIAFNDLGDEIGPVVDAAVINSQPLIKGCFLEYLQRQGRTPDFFGARLWDDIEANDFYEPTDSGLSHFSLPSDLIPGGSVF
jgi:hypothetical protein